MAAVNEAYRVLGDPARRATYDAGARGDDPRTRRARTVGHDRRAGSDPDDDGRGDGRDDWHDEPDDPFDGHDLAGLRRTAQAVISPPGPARVPWKLMGIAALVGSTVVLVASTFTDPPSEEPPDGIVRSGSCVEIESNGDAREVACTGDGDVVVDVLVPTGARCPVGTEPHRDRLGLGTVCIEVGG